MNTSESAGLSMKKAVGTSLFIIATIAVAGIFLGSHLSQWVDGKKLKTSFGWFVLVMGIYIIFKEVQGK